MSKGEVKPVETKRIRVAQGMTLVEWKDDENIWQRYWVSPEMILSEKDRTVIVDRPTRGYPYGDDLLEEFTPTVTKVDLLRELRARGIWSKADLKANPNAARAAIQSAYGLDLAQLLQLANTRK